MHWIHGVREGMTVSKPKRTHTIEKANIRKAKELTRNMEYKEMPT
ncbi:hypothetical protein J2S16_003863 [Cytobacillus kochii]|nr:hypothetical protein [Cytobacillus kochii]